MTVAIGIDVGGTTMIGARVDSAGNAEGRVVLPRPRSGGAMRTEPLDLVSRLMTPDVVAVGLGVAGLVQWPEGEFVWGPNTAGEHIGLRALVEGALGLPVAVDNDANAALLAEARLGAARGRDHIVMVTLGTGIGGGLMINGEIYRGRSFAGELGHLRLDPTGPVCTCGQRGCWETYVSGRRLDELAGGAARNDPNGMTAVLAGDSSPSGRHLTEAASRGDNDARLLVEGVGTWLGLGLASLIAALDPELIVIGGAAAASGDSLLGPARRAIAGSLEGARHRSETPIVCSHYGGDSAMIGAGLMALESLDA